MLTTTSCSSCNFRPTCSGGPSEQNLNEREFLSPTNERLLAVSVGLISLIAFEALAVATAMPTVVKELEGENLYALVWVW